MSNSPSPSPPLKAGSLTYTPASLRVLFGWLLAGDVVFMLCEKIESNILPIILKSHHATDTQIALIITTIQAIVTGTVNPVVSYYSDRLRSKWGRRIPYIIWGTPLLSLALLATPFAPELAGWMSRIPILKTCLGWFDASPVIVAFALIAIVYRMVQNVVNSMFFALFRDVVPMTHMGRFLGLFRIFGSLATFVVTFWLVGLAQTHGRLIFAIVAVVNLIGFGLICFKVKEGEYPPEPGRDPLLPVPSPLRRLRTAVTVFIRDAYSDPLIFWTNCARGTSYIATGLFSFIIFFPQHELHIPLDRAGMILSAPTALWILVAYPIGRLMDRMGASPIMGFSLLVAAVTYGVSFFFVSGPVGFTVATVIGGVAYWAILLSQLQLAQEIYPLQRYGQISAAQQMQIALVLAVLVTPLVGWSLDTLRELQLVIRLPLLGELPVGPYRTVNLMLALVFILSWLCLQKVDRLRRTRGMTVATG